MSNSFKTALLLGLLTGIILGIGQLFGGSQGLVIAFVFAVLINFGSYWFSDKIVLAMYNAREVSGDDAPELYRTVQNLTVRAQLPMPRLYVIPSESPNAFATGRDPQHAAVAVTEGILRIMNREELEGVIAHELSHVKNRDILIGTIAATLAGVVMMLANMARWAAIFGVGRSDRDEEGGGGILGMILMSVLAPIAAMMIQMAISRSREFLADATGAKIAGNPLGLASGLAKLARASEMVPLEARPETAHMFIVSPLTGGSFLSLFSTHPPVEERIARLRAMTY
ncbi:MAG: protease HtpX [Deltaproteobacteria bacterium RIFCSPHIGHO2_02_FULL_60_17]|nr:MAG: protease HtpX [Deltaproteobacteria bacterium RIFCSPHIGHO2_02_FULL_60_17]